MFAAFIILGVCTVIELFVCHFTFWWILALIARGLYSLRVVGATFKVKRLVVTEAIAFASMLLWNMLFAKGNMPWFRLLMFLVFGAICCLTMFIDDQYFILEIKDAEEVVNFDLVESPTRRRKESNKKPQQAVKKKPQQNKKPVPKNVAKKKQATRRKKHNA